MDDIPFMADCPSFGATPVAGPLYLTDAHRDILAMVRTWMHGDGPVLVLTGEQGVGKTSLVQEISAVLGGSLRIGRIARVSPSTDLRLEVPHALGLQFDPSPGDLTIGAPGVLAQCHGLNRPCLLILDDAQGLSDQALDYLTQLTTLPRGRTPLIHLLLVGKPGLEAVLARPAADLLRNRIGGRLRLAPFNRDETADYIAHRFRTGDCPCHSGTQVFDPEGLGLLHEASGGVPAAINYLVQRCLAEARSRGIGTPDGDLVRQCLTGKATPSRTARPSPARPVHQPAAPVAPAIPAPAQPASPVPVAAPRSVTARTPVRADPHEEPDVPQGRRWVQLGVAAATAGVLILTFGSDLTDVTAPVPAQPPAPADEQALAGLDVPETAAPPPPAPATGPAVAGPPPRAGDLLAQALDAGGTDPEAAARLYARAALWGSERAAYYLGQLFESGTGVDADLERARGWYAMAAGIDGAMTRLADLATASAPPGPPVGAPPVPVLQTVFTTGQTELHWRGPPGPDPAMFRVEYVPQGSDGQVQRIDTAASGLLVSQPVARWRVLGLQADGTEGPASGWSPPPPGP